VVGKADSINIIDLCDIDCDLIAISIVRCIDDKESNHESGDKRLSADVNS
jgi:hypothetical protein